MNVLPYQPWGKSISRRPETWKRQPKSRLALGSWQWHWRARVIGTALAGRPHACLRKLSLVQVEAASAHSVLSLPAAPSNVRPWLLPYLPPAARHLHSALSLAFTTMQHGDDLEDDFVLDDLVAMSEEEDLPEAEDVGGLLSADEEGGAEQSSPAQSAALAEKKRKRRAKEKERKAKVRLNPHIIFSSSHAVLGLQKRKLVETVEPVEPPSVSAQPPVLLADYITSMQAKTFSKLSGIELADVQIPGEHGYMSDLGVS